MPLSDFAENVRMHGLAKEMPKDWNPFEERDGKWRLRFDELKFEMPQDWAGGLLLTYRWRGHDVFHERVWPSPQPGETVTLSGIEGFSLVKAV